MDVRVTGAPDASELAALLAVLTRAEPAPPGNLERWRARRREALRPPARRGAAQQTR